MALIIPSEMLRKSTTSPDVRVLAGLTDKMSEHGYDAILQGRQGWMFRLDARQIPAGERTMIAQSIYSILPDGSGVALTKNAILVKIPVPSEPSSNAGQKQGKGREDTPVIEQAGGSLQPVVPVPAIN